MPKERVQAMMKRLLASRILIAAVIVLLAVGPMNVIHALTQGPPAGFSNAPGESSCTACHFSFPLNSGPGQFSLSVPLNTGPGSTNAVNVGFPSPLTSKHGFQITARDGAGNPSGTWQVVQAGLTKDASGSPFHHEHTAAGTALSAWTFNWIAPPTLPNGPVRFYACGNEANSSFTPAGDQIYFSTAKMFQAALASPSTTWPVGTAQLLTLSAPTHPGDLYYIVPSIDPTPFSFGDPYVIEVTPDPVLLYFALKTPEIFGNINAYLDAAGQATATISIPRLPLLSGVQFHFAAITADAMLLPSEVSNRLTVTFQ